MVDRAKIAQLCFAELGGVEKGFDWGKFIRLFDYSIACQNDVEQQIAVDKRRKIVSAEQEYVPSDGDKVILDFNHGNKYIYVDYIAMTADGVFYGFIGSHRHHCFDRLESYQPDDVLSPVPQIYKFRGKAIRPRTVAEIRFDYSDMNFVYFSDGKMSSEFLVFQRNLDRWDSDARVFFDDSKKPEVIKAFNELYDKCNLTFISEMNQDKAWWMNHDERYKRSIRYYGSYGTRHSDQLESSVKKMITQNYADMLDTKRTASKTKYDNDLARLAMISVTANKIQQTQTTL